VTQGRFQFFFSVLSIMLMMEESLGFNILVVALAKTLLLYVGIISPCGTSQAAEWKQGCCRGLSP